jgi:hypothetical protein
MSVSIEPVAPTERDSQISEGECTGLVCICRGGYSDVVDYKRRIDAQAKLSELIHNLQPGEEVVVT